MVSNVYKGDKKVMHIRNVDEQLKREFKALCAYEGKSITQKIQELMREAVEKRQKEVSKKH